jgi:hypothetical protein
MYVRCPHSFRYHATFYYSHLKKLGQLVVNGILIDIYLYILNDNKLIIYFKIKINTNKFIKVIYYILTFSVFIFYDFLYLNSKINI